MEVMEMMLEFWTAESPMDRMKTARAMVTSIWPSSSTSKRRANRTLQSTKWTQAPSMLMVAPRDVVKDATRGDTPNLRVQSSMEYGR